MLEKQLIELNALIDNIDWDNDLQKWVLRGEPEDIPTVTAVEVVRGRWIHCHGKTNLWYCSNCGAKIRYNPECRTYNITKLPVYEMNLFCRCCGSQMDVEAKP